MTETQDVTDPTCPHCGSTELVDSYEEVDYESTDVTHLVTVYCCACDMIVSDYVV